jgi:hypothetical protein
VHRLDAYARRGDPSFTGSRAGARGAKAKP